MRIVPNNWSDLQHYKDRSPPWIKLHKKLLDDYEWHSLPVASRALAPMLWLLASDHSAGEIDARPKKLAFRLRMTEQEVITALKPLIDNGFFHLAHDDSESLAEVVRDAIPETETETETETEKRKAQAPLPDWIDKDAWEGYAEMRKKLRKPMTDRAKQMVLKKLEEMRGEGVDYVAALNKSTQNCWIDVYAPKPGDAPAVAAGVPFV